MAEHLASIFGTEKDIVDCPFNFKIGACRHGHRCARLHTKPSSSPTLLLSNMYQRPDMITPGVDPQGQHVDPKKIQNHFDDFYQDLLEELSKYGEVQNLNICDNLADHMVGNVYVQFREEDHAAAALQHLTGRFYADTEKELRSACNTPNAKVNHVIKVDEKGLKEETANAIGASVSKRGSPMDLLHELKKEGSKFIDNA